MNNQVKGIQIRGHRTLWGARILVLFVLSVCSGLTAPAWSSASAQGSNDAHAHINIADFAPWNYATAAYGFVQDALNTLDFQPRWKSENWTGSHKLLHIGADALIAAAYLVISGAFVKTYRARPAALLAGTFWLLGVFFLAGGLTHLLDALMFWWPAYRLTALIKIATAAVSVIMAAVLFRQLPGAAAIRSPVEIQCEFEQRRKTEMELRQVHVQLESVIEQRTAELAAKNEEMEQLLNTVSHDLKSPVVTCLGLTGMLREDLNAGRIDETRETVDRIERSAARMRRLIEDLLSLSKIGKVRFELADVDTDSMVRTIRDEYAPRLAKIGATMEIEGTLPPLHADAHWLTQVFENLLSNAIKYGCDNPLPRIEVGCLSTREEHRFFVRDNGKGIDPKFHSQVFEPFKRFRTDKEGSGMGLAIVARIIKMHGGRIWLESHAGQGTTFWFALPAGLTASNKTAVSRVRTADDRKLTGALNAS